MVRKTKSTKKTIVKEYHPRKKSRGWLVLRRRWLRLLQQFGLLLRDTTSFVASKIDQRMVSLALMVIGIAAVSLWLNYTWSQNQQAWSNQQSRLKAELTLPITQQLPTPERIFIRWYVDAPVVPGVVFEGNWTLSETEAVYIGQSARPGEAGNVIIYGHNTQDLLGNIRALNGNEIITLSMTDGSSRDYQVQEMMEIKPEDVWVIQPTNYEILTLYTCSGFADTNRFVVRALPLDN